MAFKFSSPYRRWAVEKLQKDAAERAKDPGLQEFTKNLYNSVKGANVTVKEEHEFLEQRDLEEKIKEYIKNNLSLSIYSCYAENRYVLYLDGDEISSGSF